MFTNNEKEILHSNYLRSLTGHFAFPLFPTDRFGVVNKSFDPPPLHAGGVLELGDGKPYEKSYFPIYKFADLRVTEGVGAHEMVELAYYLAREFKHQSIPEIRPVSEDKDGNWGNPASLFQLSLRFRQKQFEKGASVPAILVLRNLSESNSPVWIRNAMPDHGYKITIWHGDKTAVWSRRQKPLPEIHEIDDFPLTDPMRVSLKGHFGEITAIELNRYFYLNDYGNYTIQAKLEVPMENGNGMTNLFSGKAEFEIVRKIN